MTKGIPPTPRVTAMSPTPSPFTSPTAAEVPPGKPANGATTNVGTDEPPSKTLTTPSADTVTESPLAPEAVGASLSLMLTVAVAVGPAANEYPEPGASVTVTVSMGSLNESFCTFTSTKAVDEPGAKVTCPLSVW